MAEIPNILNENEIRLIELSSEIWESYCELPIQHDDDKKEFLNALHQIQHLIMIRPTRRSMPEMFPKCLKTDISVNNLDELSEILEKSIGNKLNGLQIEETEL